jgi:Domain of unknown function (DUF4405)
MHQPTLFRRLARSRYLAMFAIDVLLTLVLLLLNALLLTGLYLHELLGLAMGILAFVHLLYSWTWITQSFRRLNGRQHWRKRAGVLLNAVLFILLVTALLSGFIISRKLLPAIGMGSTNDAGWLNLHASCPGLIAIMASLHIALNWTVLLAYFKKNRLKLLSTAAGRPVTRLKKLLLPALWLLLAVVLIAALIYWLRGSPQASVAYRTDDRFRPNMASGWVQFTGTAIVVAILVYSARRWLKLKL